jgi:small subunit ribosomal protein S1
MSEESFADLFREKSVKQKKLMPGDRIEAVVANISGESIFIDIGGKSEGVVKAFEFQDKEDNCTVSLGDSIKVFFVGQRSGEMIFTTRLGTGHASLQEIEDAFHSSIPVQGKVVSEIKGGFEIQIAGQRGFCPYSQMNIRRIENPEEYIGQMLSFKVKEFAEGGRNIILSARAVLEEQRQEQCEELKKTLQEEMRVQGTVTSIRDFGAFVDLGGIDGLIPISELAWGQTDRVDDILSTGQEVEVVVKKIDWDRERISLSLRDTTDNPWSKVEENYPVGTVHQGTVARMADFGAFVTLEAGVDGLLHISKLGSGRRINHPREVVEQGQGITVRIDDIDSEKKRISLVPEDYSEKEKTGKKVKEKEYIPPVGSGSLGTIGDLFQAQLKKEK